MIIFPKILKIYKFKYFKRFNSFDKYNSYKNLNSGYNSKLQFCGRLKLNTELVIIYKQFPVQRARI